MEEMMKDSGCRWIGYIPQSWSTKRIKYIATLKGRIGWQGLTSDEYQDDGAFLITGTDFIDGGINWDTCVHVPIKRWEEAKEIQIEEGDLLITKDGTVGKVAIASGLPGETSLNSGVLRIMPIEGYSRRFLFWVLQSDVFWNWFNYRNAGNSTILHLYQDDFAEFIYAFPDEKGQEAIAYYLDKQCDKIDDVISDLEKQIEKLKEYKYALIKKCVTKGLDDSVALKDSGIRWIGKIPEHWERKRIKHITSYIGSGTTPLSGDASYYDGGAINWIQSGDLYSKSAVTDTEVKITPFALKKYSALKVLDPPYIVIAMYGASVGNIAISEISACSNQACCSIKTDKDNDLLYLYYWMLFCKEDFLSKSVGGGQPNISQVIIKNEIFIQPPLVEQQDIGKFLNSKCSNVDLIIKEKENQIEVIKNYKKSLIYEYVTGKRRVKEVG